MDTFKRDIIMSEEKRVFKIFRLYDSNHIILNANFLYKKNYYFLLRKVVFNNCKDISKIGGDDFFRKAKGFFFDSEEVVNDDLNYSILNKVFKKRPSGFFKYFKKPIFAYNYLYNLVIEAAYLLYVYGSFSNKSYLRYMENILSLKENKLIWFEKYFDLLFSKKWSDLYSYISSSKIKYMADSVTNITQHIEKIFNYQKSPEFNVSIISTMSAGKSTFINALIGNEIFPESQQACTAKITSIYDNDSFKEVVGYASYKNEIKFIDGDLERKDVKSWNDDLSIDRIILEGDLNNISSSKKIVAVHDTPGTNFSGDEKHKKITIDFLKNTNLDLVICLINAEYMGTTDAKDVLVDLKKIVGSKNNLKTVFVLNKIDSFDIKKESIEDSIFSVNDFLKNMGFDNNILIPISTKAARLFKMVISNKQYQFSENEMDDFRSLFRKFSKGFIAEPLGVELLDKNISNSREVRTVDDIEYSLKDIEEALYNTGFSILENIINSLGDSNG